MHSSNQLSAKAVCINLSVLYSFLKAQQSDLRGGSTDYAAMLSSMDAAYKQYQQKWRAQGSRSLGGSKDKAAPAAAAAAGEAAPGRREVATDAAALAAAAAAAGAAPAGARVPAWLVGSVAVWQMVLLLLLLRLLVVVVAQLPYQGRQATRLSLILLQGQQQQQWLRLWVVVVDVVVALLLLSLLLQLPQLSWVMMAPMVQHEQ
jgi:hypothetical protein